MGALSLQSAKRMVRVAVAVSPWRSARVTMVTTVAASWSTSRS